MAKSKEMTSTRRTMHYFWQEVKRNWRYNLPLLILVPTTVFLGGYASNWIISDMINTLTTTTVTADQVWNTFGGFIILYAIAILLNEGIGWRLVMYLGWRSEIYSIGRLNQKCFESITEQTMQFHNDKFGGSLVNQVNRFSRAFERLMDTTIWSILPIISAFIFTFLILGPRFPQFTIGLAILSFGFMLTAWLSFKKTRDASKEEANSNNKMIGQLADSITNVSTVKSYSGEKEERRLYAQRVRHWQNATFVVMRAIVARDFGFGLILTAISIMTIIFLAGGQAWFGVQIGTLVLAVTFMISLWGRLWDFNRTLRDVNQALADAHEMTEILDTPNQVKDVPNAKPLATPPHSGQVEFRDVSFKHADGGEQVFERFDLRIPAGQRIGLVGHSGSGKTTLTKLLLRFSDVQNGQILIDGQDIANVTQDSLRRAIAYVPQEPMLFHRTIAENISYGKPKATDAEIRDAAVEANAMEFIKKLPEKFKTLTGERGVKLSGGQKQRVAIARAILKDAPILVLDEATSALDTESEKLIQDALQNLMSGRTSIVIAHRLSTVAELDRIIVLDDGKIVEDGTHEELLARGGRYAQLWNRQTGQICAVIDEDEPS